MGQGRCSTVPVTTHNQNFRSFFTKLKGLETHLASAAFPPRPKG